MFLSVAQDILREHGRLLEGWVEISQDMDIQDKLRYNFTEYILYLYRNQEIQQFLNTSLFHIPVQLREKIRSNYLEWETSYRKRLEDVFATGMKQGLIRQGDPAQKVWSFKAKRDGVAAWLSGSPDLNEESIEKFWNDFWFGVAE